MFLGTITRSLVKNQSLEIKTKTKIKSKTKTKTRFSAQMEEDFFNLTTMRDFGLLRIN